MGKNLMMAREGTGVVMDGLNLSWPAGGERQIVKAPKHLSLRIKERIINGAIMETDDPPTKIPDSLSKGERKLYTGDEARAVRAEPAGPVTRMQLVRSSGEAQQVPVRRVNEPAPEAVEEAAPVEEEKPKRRLRTGNRAPKTAAPAEQPAPLEPDAASAPTEARELREP